jgi:hypothetical protein
MNQIMNRLTVAAVIAVMFLLLNSCAGDLARDDGLLAESEECSSWGIIWASTNGSGEFLCPGGKAGTGIPFEDKGGLEICTSLGGACDVYLYDNGGQVWIEELASKAGDPTGKYVEFSYVLPGGLSGTGIEAISKNPGRIEIDIEPNPVIRSK